MEAQGNVKSIKTTQWTPLIQQYTYLHRYHVHTTHATINVSETIHIIWTFGYHKTAPSKKIPITSYTIP